MQSDVSFLEEMYARMDRIEAEGEPRFAVKMYADALEAESYCLRAMPYKLKHMRNVMRIAAIFRVKLERGGVVCLKE